MAKTRRLQILIEPEQFERLERASTESGASMGSIIRDAIDRYVPPEPIDRSSALEFLLNAPEIDVGDWSEMKRVIHDEMAGLQ